MDILSLLGIILAFVAILGGNLLEGGAVSSLFNGPAGLIVVGGTLAATILQTSWPMLKRAFGQVGAAAVEHPHLELRGWAPAPDIAQPRGPRAGSKHGAHADRRRELVAPDSFVHHQLRFKR